MLNNSYAHVPRLGSQRDKPRNPLEGNSLEAYKPDS